ncbi:DUF885 domain-containing protein [Halorutilales archaeon Cl-col2-1]
MTDTDDQTQTETEAVVSDYFDRVLERNPHMATVLGVHDYDSDVPDGSRESVVEEIEDAKDVLEELRGLDEDTVSKQAAVSSLEYDLYEMDELRLWESDPQAVDGVVSLIYPLFVRDFAPFEERLERIADRLEDCPDYIEETKSRLTDPVDEWVESEIEACAEIPGLLQLIADHAGDIERQDVAYRISANSQDVIDAVDDYRDWLESLDTRSYDPVGEEKLDRLLELRYLPPSSEVIEIAESEIDAADEDLRDAVSKIDAPSFDEAIESVESDHPETFDGVIDEYRRTADAAYRLTDGDFADVPESSLRISETPERLRPLIGDSGYVEPTPLGEKDAVYYVSPPADSEMLRFHNVSEIAYTVFSDVFPGHHLQQVYSCLSPSRVNSLAGRFNSFGDDFVEGWRGYTAQTAIESGFVDELDTGATAEGLRLVSAEKRIRNACRAVVDMRLSRGEMTVDEAADYLVEEAGFEPEAAWSEAVAYSRNPGNGVSFTVGKRLLSDLADETDFSTRDFHSRLLEAGGIPVELHRHSLEAEDV